MKVSGQIKMDNEKAPGSDHAGEDAGKTGIVDEKIGSRLKSYYDSIVDEGTPAHQG